MTPIHIQWADDGQHIRKWARDPFAGSTEYTAIATPIAEDAVVTISGKSLHDYVDRAYVRQRIGELIDEEEGGFWRACSGCQESVDGCVSATDYPYNETFRCHPGSGCRECGGIGVIWDDTDYSQMARDMAHDDALEERAKAGGKEADAAALQYLSSLEWLPSYVSTYIDQRRLNAIGEATLAASRSADPNATPEGTREALATCATMLETYMPECLPANEQGQVDFVRCMTDATAAEIRAFLASEGTPA